MILQTEYGRVDTSAGIDVGITANFEGKGPLLFGVSPATATPLEAGGTPFQVSAGGSVNCHQISFIPHCHGTHTETAGHICSEILPISEVAPLSLLLSEVISVTPVTFAETEEECTPSAEADDLVITESALKIIKRDSRASALLIRTLPNSEEKALRNYRTAPYFTVAAMRYLLETGVNHLLIDLPSLDRLADNGVLMNHRLFWNIAPGSTALPDASNRMKTVTELIYISDEVSDGMYLLSLQVPRFEIDAAPSRPVLYPFIKEEM